MRRKKERKVNDEKKRKKSIRKREKQRKEKKSIRGLKGSWKKEKMAGKNSQNKTRICDSSEHFMKGNGRRGNN